MMRVGIIGAGPAGITAAYQLSKMGVEVEVFEADVTVGGMAKTIELWNQKVDLGPHRFFSKDRRVNQMWLEVVGKDYEMVKRLTRIYYKGKFYYYPLKPFDALAKLGLMPSVQCLLSFVGEQLKKTQQDGSFENWVVSRFGRKLFEIFFKSYSEKLWGISCKELDADFAAQRIKKLSLFEAIAKALFPSKVQKHKTLVEEFAYPHGGTGSVYQAMARKTLSTGGKVLCQTRIKKILVNQKTAFGIELESGEQRLFDHVISTMPITLMVQGLPDVPPEVLNASRSLTFRNTILVYLNICSESLFPDQWIYVQSPEFQTGRITNFRNWTPHLFGQEKNTILAMEYWCNDHDHLWTAPDKEIIDLAKKEIIQIGLKAHSFVKRNRDDLLRARYVEPHFEEKLRHEIKMSQITDGRVHRIHRCYPVYKRGYKQSLKIVEAYLNTLQNLSVIGRYGAYKYNNQDHGILMGILAAENIALGKKHDLWAVNTDYDDYQETSTITKTGLSKE